MERQFFCSYRRATEAGVSMHSCGVSPFWTTLAPQLGHCDEAVQHALVALGAAYHLYKIHVGKGASSHLQVSSPAVGTLERFTWREYNLAIRNLHRHLDKPEPASIAVVLVSCLAFISLELLRGDHYTAIAHMRNGIRILMSALDVRRLRAAPSRRRARGSFLSDAELWDIVTQFRNVEFALGGFSSDIPLLLGQQLRGDTPDARPIASVAQGYDARTQYVNEVMVRCWELREHRGSQVFWAQPHMQQELNTLRQRGVAIMSALELLWAGPQAPPLGTWLSYSSQMDWLLVNSARTMIQLVPFGIDSHLKMAQDPCFQDELSRGVSFAAKMLLAHNLEGKPPSDYTLETGLIALMYWSYVYSTRLRTKEAALRILQESTQREGPWDASLSLRFLSRDTKPRLLISFWREPQAITHPAIPWQLRVVEH